MQQDPQNAKLVQNVTTSQSCERGDHTVCKFSSIGCDCGCHTATSLRDKIAIEVEQCQGFRNPKTRKLEYPCSAAKNEADRILKIVEDHYGAEQPEPDFVIPARLVTPCLWLLRYAFADVNFGIMPNMDEQPSEEIMDEIQELVR